MGEKEKKRGEVEFAGDKKKLTCGICGLTFTHEEMLTHLDTHFCGTFINVYNGKATLTKCIRVRTSYVNLFAKPQPPQEMLQRAISENGGGLTLSGRYPISKDLERWLEEKNPEWEQ